MSLVLLVSNLPTAGYCLAPDTITGEKRAEYLEGVLRKAVEKFGYKKHRHSLGFHLRSAFRTAKVAIDLIALKNRGNNQGFYLLMLEGKLYIVQGKGRKWTVLSENEVKKGSEFKALYAHLIATRVLGKEPRPEFSRKIKDVIAWKRPLDLLLFIKEINPTEFPPAVAAERALAVLQGYHAPKAKRFLKRLADLFRNSKIHGGGMTVWAYIPELFKQVPYHPEEDVLTLDEAKRLFAPPDAHAGVEDALMLAEYFESLRGPAVKAHADGIQLDLEAGEALGVFSASADRKPLGKIPNHILSLLRHRKMQPWELRLPLLADQTQFLVRAEYLLRGRDKNAAVPTFNPFTDILFDRRTFGRGALGGATALMSDHPVIKAANKIFPLSSANLVPAPMSLNPEDDLMMRVFIGKVLRGGYSDYSGMVSQEDNPEAETRADTPFAKLGNARMLFKREKLFQSVARSLRSAVDKGVVNYPKHLQDLKDAVMYNRFLSLEERKRLLKLFNQLLPKHAMQESILEIIPPPALPGTLAWEYRLGRALPYIDELELWAYRLEEANRIATAVDVLSFNATNHIHLTFANLESQCGSSGYTLTWKERKRLQEVSTALMRVLRDRLIGQDVADGGRKRLEEVTKGLQRIYDSASIQVDTDSTEDIEPEWQSLAGECDLSKEELRWLIAYIKDYLKANEGIISQNSEKLLESLLEDKRLDIALYPASQEDATVHAFAAVQRDFLNKMPGDIRNKIFTRKIKSGDIADFLQDFLRQTQARVDRIADEQRGFVEEFLKSERAMLDIRLMDMEDFSSSRGQNPAHIVYRITLGLGDKAIALYLKGESSIAIEKYGRHDGRNEEFYMKFLRLIGLPSIVSRYYSLEEKQPMTGVLIMQTAQGMPSQSLFDEEGLLRAEYRDRRIALIEEFARNSAAGDAMARGDRTVVQVEYPQYPTNFMVHIPVLEAERPRVLSIDNARILDERDQSLIIFNKKNAETEIGVISRLPEFSEDEAKRYELLAVFLDAYMRQWRQVWDKRNEIERLMIETYGKDSGEQKIFLKRMAEDPMELLNALAADLFAHYGFAYNAQQMELVLLERLEQDSPDIKIEDALGRWEFTPAKAREVLRNPPEYAAGEPTRVVLTWSNGAWKLSPEIRASSPMLEYLVAFLERMREIAVREKADGFQLDIQTPNGRVLGIHTGGEGVKVFMDTVTGKPLEIPSNVLAALRGRVLMDWQLKFFVTWDSKRMEMLAERMLERNVLERLKEPSRRDVLLAAWGAVVAQLFEGKPVTRFIYGLGTGTATGSDVLKGKMILPQSPIDQRHHHLGLMQDIHMFWGPGTFSHWEGAPSLEKQFLSNSSYTKKEARRAIKQAKEWDKRDSKPSRDWPHGFIEDLVDGVSKLQIRQVVERGVEKDSVALEFLKTVLRGNFGYEAPRRFALVQEYNSLVAPENRIESWTMDRVSAVPARGSVAYRMRQWLYRELCMSESHMLEQSGLVTKASPYSRENQDADMGIKFDGYRMIPDEYIGKMHGDIDVKITRDKLKSIDWTASWDGLRKMREIANLGRDIVAGRMGPVPIGVKRMFEEIANGYEKLLLEMLLKPDPEAAEEIWDEDWDKLFEGKGFSVEQQKLLVAYTREYLLANEDAVSGDLKEIVRALLDEGQWDIPIGPAGPWGWEDFVATQKDFLNKMPKDLLVKIFAAKIKAPEFQVVLGDFLGKGEVAELALENVKDFSLKRAGDAARVIYRLEMAAGEKKFVIFVKGEGSVEKARNEEFYARYLEEMGLPYRRVKHYAWEGTGAVKALVLQEEFQGKFMENLLDADGMLRPAYAPSAGYIAEQLGRQMAAGDLMGRANHSWRDYLLGEDQRLLALDNEDLSVEVSAIPGQSEIGFLTKIPGFLTDEATRYQLLAQFMIGTMDQRRVALAHRGKLGALMREMFGADSTHRRMFVKNLSAYPLGQVRFVGQKLFADLRLDWDERRLALAILRQLQAAAPNTAIRDWLRNEVFGVDEAIRRVEHSFRDLAGEPIHYMLGWDQMCWTLMPGIERSAARKDYVTAKNVAIDACL